VVGFSQLILLRDCGCCGFGAGIGPMTGGVRPGGVAGAVAAGGGVAAGAARQSGADAISPSAARLKRLELCFTNIGPPMFLRQSVALRAFGRGGN
jgi:hypothetical protein